MYRSKPTASKNKTSDHKYLVPVRNHYKHLLEFRKEITERYGIKQSDIRLKSLIKFESNPIINESSPNKDLNNYEADLIDFIYKCDPDVFAIVAKQFKTEDGYDCGSQFTVKGKVHPSVFWEMLKNYWDNREKQMKIEEDKKVRKEKKEKKAADDRKAEEEKKVAEDEKRQEVRQTPKIIGIKEIQDYVDKCCDHSSQQNSNFNLESSRSSLLLNLDLPYSSQLSTFPREFANEVRKESPEFFKLMIDNAKKIEGYNDRYRYVHFLDICRVHYEKANKNQDESKPKQEESKQEQKADTSQINKSNEGKENNRQTFFFNENDVLKDDNISKRKVGVSNEIKTKSEKEQELINKETSDTDDIKQTEVANKAIQVSYTNLIKDDQIPDINEDECSSNDERKKQEAAAKFINANAQVVEKYNIGQESQEILNFKANTLKNFKNKKNKLKVLKPNSKTKHINQIVNEYAESSDAKRIEREGTADKTTGTYNDQEEEKLKAEIETTIKQALPEYDESRISSTVENKLDTNGDDREKSDSNPDLTSFDQISIDEESLIIANEFDDLEQLSVKVKGVSPTEIKNMIEREIEQEELKNSNKMPENDEQKEIKYPTTNIDAIQSINTFNKFTESTPPIASKHPNFVMETEISGTQIMRLTPSETYAPYESMLSSLSTSCRYLSINLVSNLIYSQGLSATTVSSNLKEIQFNDERMAKDEFIDSSLLSLVPQSKCSEIIFKGFDGAVLAKLIENGRKHLSGVRMVRVEESGEIDKWIEQISEIEGLAAISLYQYAVIDKWIKKIEKKGILIMT